MLLAAIGTLAVSKPAVPQGEASILRAPCKVVDAQGRTLLDVVVLDGRPVLRLLNLSGQTIAGLGDTGKGGMLSLRDGKGNLAASLSHGQEGGQLVLFNSHGKTVYRKP